MRTFPLLLLCLLSMGINNAASAASLTKEQRVLFFGHDSRQPIVKPDTRPWQAIGQVETASGNLCTATLISPYLALTAGALCSGAAGKYRQSSDDPFYRRASNLALSKQRH